MVVMVLSQFWTFTVCRRDVDDVRHRRYIAASQSSLPRGPYPGAVSCTLATSERIVSLKMRSRTAVIAPRPPQKQHRAAIDQRGDDKHRCQHEHHDLRHLEEALDWALLGYWRSLIDDVDRRQKRAHCETQGEQDVGNREILTQANDPFRQSRDEIQSEVDDERGTASG